MEGNDKKNQYAILMNKLKKATYNEFYYEAIFIEYAILEDRTNSLLNHANIVLKDNKLSKKLNCLENNKKFECKYVRKHISKDLISQIHDWKNERNKLIHDLVNVEYNLDEIKMLALDGECLVKKFASKSQLVNKYFEKQ